MELDDGLEKATVYWEEQVAELEEGLRLYFIWFF